MKTVKVTTKSKEYPVYIGDGLLDNAGELAANIIGVCKAAIITDDTVDRLYSKRLEDSLKSSGFETVKFVFSHGESSKTTDTLVSVLNFLAENRLSSADAVFALGGGVTGDLAGFAASIYLRGIKLVQLPTTLLAMVDSSVGGKTAVDLNCGKNQVGSFYQPYLVICDSKTLITLDTEQTANGYAEIIKYGVICDREMFSLLKEGTLSDLTDIIVRCVEIKRDIVSSDERDTGIRRLLNFGHTFGHAIEKYSGFTVNHGYAVSMGMMIMTKACAALGICGRTCVSELTEILMQYNLPVKTDYPADELFDIVLSDKKRSSDSITLVIIEDIGKCTLKSVPISEVLNYLMKGTV